MAMSDYYIQDNSDIEDKKLEAAKKLYLAGNYSGALKLYLDMVNTSYSYKLHYEIGRCYYKLNDFQNARNYFLNSVNLEEIKNPSYVFLGNIYYKEQNIQKAIEYWITAFSYKPEDESVCLNLATSYFSKDMKFQSISFYEKYLKYAKDKSTSYYLEIKKSISEFIAICQDFYKKAVKAYSMQDSKTAIQSLEYALKSYPIHFDSNFLLGKLYFSEQKYLQASAYFKQAYCTDPKSLDVLERLSSVMLALGDYTGAYCCLKRILPLIIHNQKEYLEVVRNLKELEDGFDDRSYQGHEYWANYYYNENNYHLALFEYENCMIVNPELAQQYDEKVQKIRSYINPENRIIKTCLEKGLTLYSAGDFRQANKYFSKILILADENSSDYKYAKSRMANV